MNRSFRPNVSGSALVDTTAHAVVSDSNTDGYLQIMQRLLNQLPTATSPGTPGGQSCGCKRKRQAR